VGEHVRWRLVRGQVPAGLEHACLLPDPFPGDCRALRAVVRQAVHFTPLTWCHLSTLYRWKIRPVGWGGGILLVPEKKINRKEGRSEENNVRKNMEEKKCSVGSGLGSAQIRHFCVSGSRFVIKLCIRFWYRIRIQNFPTQRHSHEIFNRGFSLEPSLPSPLIYILKLFQIWLRICRDILIKMSFCVVVHSAE
jgi:hypothetical protein